MEGNAKGDWTFNPFLALFFIFQFLYSVKWENQGSIVNELVVVHIIS